MGRREDLVCSGGGGEVLQAVHQLLLLLENVLELAQGGLHLLEGELVLALAGLVLRNPGVEVGDGVVEQLPLFDQGVNLLDPVVGDGLDLHVALLEGSNLDVSFLVGGHLLGGHVSQLEHLEVVNAGLLEAMDLGGEGLGLRQVGWLAEALGGRGLCLDQPGCELLDAGSVLGPELNVLAVLVALALGLCQEVGDILGDAAELVLELLGVGGDLIA